MEFDPSEDPSSDHIPPLLAILPFLSSADDTTDSDTPDTSPSPTHVLASGQPIPHGRPYRYHLNGPVHMMTARKRVGPLPTHRLVVRHSINYSSSYHFSLDDSSSSSSSETSSDSHADVLSDFASSRSSFDHSLLESLSGTRSSHRLCSLVPSVQSSSAVSERPSHDSSSASPTDLKECLEDRFKPYVPREVGLEVDFEDESFESSRSRGADLEMDVDVMRSDEIEIYTEIQAKIDECFAYADALRDRGIDVRVVVKAVDREESETGTRGLVEVRVERVTHPVMPEDTPEPAQEEAVEVTYETLGDLAQRFHDHTEAIPVYRIQVIEGAQREQGRRIIGAESVVTVLTKRVAELERDNRRLRGTVSVESQIDQLQRGMARMKMPNTRSRASRTREAVNEQSDRRMAEALRVRDVVRNLRPLMGDEVEQEEVGGNGNEGNGDRGNRNGGNGDEGN
ncbi:hypothetical protein Tco_1391047 [Tanacetum coccineum]